MNGDVTPAFLQYGALGILTLACIIAVRVLFAQVQADKKRESERADRNESELRDLNRTVQEQVIPAALAMVDATKELIQLLAHERARRG